MWHCKAGASIKPTRTVVDKAGTQGKEVKFLPWRRIVEAGDFLWMPYATP